MLSEIEEPDYEISDQEDIPNWTVKSKPKPKIQVIKEEPAFGLKRRKTETVNK